MELTELVNGCLSIFEVNDVDGLHDALFKCVTTNDIHKYSRFKALVKDLSVDWLQKIFEYYQADRKEKMQDYTPKSLAKLIAKLSKHNDVIDLCCGSGALTIQKWNEDSTSTFLLKEFDNNVLPYLMFNMGVRNIQCQIQHCDVLSGEVFKTYTINKGEEFGIYESNNI